MKKGKDALGDRMKEYENISRVYLTRKIPVIIRVDGKAFHSFTKGLERPFSEILATAMDITMKKLCENIQGAKLGYVQSDEISILLTDYATISTDAWFGNDLRKITSISASMATAFFHEAIRVGLDRVLKMPWNADDKEAQAFHRRLSKVYERTYDGPYFDSRAFSIPKEEVCNYFIWRQQDATRNSIEMAGRAYFSHRELNQQNTNMIQDMLMTVYNVNWNDYPTRFKRGGCAYRKEFVNECMKDPRNPEKTITVTRNRWIIDQDIPIFTKDREYVEKWL